MNIKSIIQKNIEHFDISGISESDIDNCDYSNACYVIDELYEIYDGRYRYDLNYAYSNANQRITRFYDDFMDDFQLQKNKYNSSKLEHHHISLFVDRLYKHVSKLHVNYKWLNTTILIVSLLLSLGLILSVHWLTEQFVEKFEALIDSIIIIVVLGVFKLFLEEKLLKERVRKRGWTIYKRSVDITKNNFAKVILSFLLMKKANESDLTLNQLVGKHKLLLHSLHNHFSFEIEK